MWVNFLILWRSTSEYKYKYLQCQINSFISKFKKKYIYSFFCIANSIHGLSENIKKFYSFKLSFYFLWIRFLFFALICSFIKEELWNLNIIFEPLQLCILDFLFSISLRKRKENTRKEIFNNTLSKLFLCVNKINIRISLKSKQKLPSADNRLEKVFYFASWT